MKRAIDIVIVILKALLAILSVIAGAGAVFSGPAPGLAAAGMQPASWVWILGGVMLVLAGLTWLFTFWRERGGPSEDPLWDQILDIVDWLLKALAQETGKLLREIPQSVVEQAAKDVYRQFIANKPLAGLMSEADFVAMVVEQWRRIAGVETLVARTVEQSAAALYRPGR